MQYGCVRQVTRRGVTAANIFSRRPLLRSSVISSLRCSSSSNAPATPQSTTPPIPTRQWSTPLARTIASAIEATGPVSIASYMRQCLTNPEGGYYTATRPSTDADQFGTKGDFVTSPEISQIFGELVGVWFMTEWMAQGRPKEGVTFIEMGPGRGTLMSDILRTIGQFRSFAGAVNSVWLVEAGEGLRQKQKEALCGEAAEMVEKSDQSGKNVWWEARSKYANITVKWVEDVILLPKQDENETRMPFIIAHEFFDALPIHAFESVAPKPQEEQKTELLDRDGNPMVRPSAASKVPQWRELLVTPTKRKFTIPKPVVEGSTSHDTKEAEPEFHLMIAKASTPTSLILPERPRYRKLKSQPESRIEISPESARYVQDFAQRIGGEKTTTSKSKPAGAALIIDYGPLETIPVNSLRGIRKHKVISPFAYAGEADISADVDFGALADASLVASPGVEVHGPVEQGAWLTQLGIQDRAERLIKNMPEDWAGEVGLKRKELELGWRRLVESGPKGMGKAYKVMAILPENQGQRRPVGFGGGVVG